MIKRIFLLERFIMVLLILRPFCLELSLPLFLAVIGLFVLLHYFIEGCRLSILTILACVILTIYGEMYPSELAVLLGSVMIGVGFWLPLDCYQLERQFKVGLKFELIRHTNGEELTRFDFHPLDTEQPGTVRRINWYKGKGKAKLIQIIEKRSRLLGLLMKLGCLSYVDQVVFSAVNCSQRAKVPHTIFFIKSPAMTIPMYSELLSSLARSSKIIADQSSQETILDTAYLEPHFQSQIGTNVFVAAHADGCTNAIERYSRIASEFEIINSGIVLLYPNLNDLTEKLLTQSIGTKVLLVGNQETLMDQRVKLFISNQSNVSVVIWRNTDSLNVTDLSRLIGGLLSMAGYPRLSQTPLGLTVAAINLFIQQGTIGDQFCTSNRIFRKE